MNDCVKLIYEQSRLNPDHICIIEGERKISYKDFIEMAGRLANYFLSFSDNPKVLLNLRQGIDAYATILATMLAGGYYCPLNVDAPFNKKLKQVHQFAPDLVISETDDLVLHGAIDKNPHITLSELFKKDISRYSIDHLLQRACHDLAYIISTSGSSGEPKGVMIRREALNKFLEWSVNAYECSCKDLWSQYSLLSFDLSIVDIFTALCSGATLVTLREIVHKIRPSSALNTFPITVWHSVPTLVDFMIKNERSAPADLSTLRLMSFCGEPLYTYHLEYLFNKNPELTILNTYGPTEGTLFCTYKKLNASNYRAFAKHNVSIGEPIPGWSVILRNNDNEADTKEIVLSGNYLAAGYLNTPSEKFINVEDAEGVNKAFITGDLAKIIDDNLYFVGRSDRQIKLRGNRIELDEIDFYIRQYTGRKSLSVLYCNAIHSFVEDCTTDKMELNQFLQFNLEPFKIPAHIYYISAFPLNANYKVDHAGLYKLIEEP